MNDAATTPSGRVRSHRFSNRFAGLDPYDRAEEFLAALGGVGNGPDGPTGPLLADPDSDREADIDAGIAFFGQFIDHEITFDPTSSLERRNDPAALENFRTPALDLDSVYGSGAEVRPFLYDDRDPDGAKLLVGPAEGGDPTDGTVPRAARFGATDLQRNRQGAALITDARNDENVVISQLQLAFTKLHNRVVDYLRSGSGHDQLEDQEELFETAARLVRWHYQWVVREEFVPAVCDHSVLDDIDVRGRSFFLQPDSPVSIPVEFAGAAYRYGHSQIRDRYTVNTDSEAVKFFPGPAPEQLRPVLGMAADGGVAAAGESGPPPEAMESDEPNLNGFRPVPADLVVDWSYFFGGDPDTDRDAQPGRPVDAGLPPALFLLPFVEEGPRSLAARNLLRGRALGLPSGQALATAMGIEPLTNDELPLPSGRSFADYLRSVHRGADRKAPLWLYVLAEADVHGDGHRLGALGSRIVAEVITGMVAADEEAFVNVEPEWTPTLPRLGDDDGPYRIADLLAFATGPAPDGLEIAALDADGSGPAPDTADDDRTNGEAVVLEHRGAGPLDLEGYTIDYEEQTETFEHVELAPGERLVVYTGDGPADPPADVRTVAFGRRAAVIADAGESVVVRTPTGEVSAFAVHEG
jgi:hypothetical protein